MKNEKDLYRGKFEYAFERWKFNVKLFVIAMAICFAWCVLFPESCTMAQTDADIRNDLIIEQKAMEKVQKGYGE